jgi:hypothetical protein
LRGSTVIWTEALAYIKVRLLRGGQVCLAGVVIVDLGREEFQDAPGRLRRRREERGGLQFRGTGAGDVGGGHGASGVWI